MIVENPVKMTDETVKKIEEAFLMDCTIEEACFMAKITKQCYYNWLESFPELKERFDLMRNNLKLKAKTNISKEIDKGDKEVSKWYLERRAKKEFGVNVDITSDNEKINIVQFEIIKKDETKSEV